MKPETKAELLFNKHGLLAADSIADSMLDENQNPFVLSKIDFWLDVKLALKNL